MIKLNFADLVYQNFSKLRPGISLVPRYIVVAVKSDIGTMIYLKNKDIFKTKQLNSKL